ncbi:pyridoxal phosphate-dependent decarboxylase family protein [Portibacter marinus]|uniref:pyridoxal phosphate-dependent decarboxylase family protein n=1 Tax=Portibacter marinus TaxID=2898660 RepID=UPI001F1D182C|nr:aspartate aminotransferase family protein [Portibacter marinus]
MKGFPEQGRSIEELVNELEQLKANDLNYKEGRAFSYVYHVSEQVSQALQLAYSTFFSENALNPSAFPSLSQMQSEVITMCKDLFHAGDSASGLMTSGGTESILMAVKAAKEWAVKKRGIAHPELVMSVSAHPAFNKACDYFGIKTIILPIDENYKAVPDLYREAINQNTIMIVASAPSYPQGVVDPIPEIAEIALDKEVPFHVDACVGGFVLPFIKESSFPKFDFRVKGVTSLSADIHKYGFASKGSSVVIYRDREMRKSQFYVYTGWPGGIYASPSILGTKPGGAIAVAWTVLQLFGRSGYEKHVSIMMDTARMFQNFLETFEGIRVIGKPDMCLFSIGSNSFDIYELGDEMHELGWQMDRQQDPPALHLSISPVHARVFEAFNSDFQQAYNRATRNNVVKLKNRLQVNAARGLKKVLPKKTFKKLQKLAVDKSDANSNRSAALYGMIGDLKGSGTLDEMIVDFLDKMIK